MTSQPFALYERHGNRWCAVGGLSCQPDRVHRREAIRRYCWSRGGPDNPNLRRYSIRPAPADEAREHPERYPEF
jgi:hypothetical protein